MLAVIQRVSTAQVTVNDEIVGQIGTGLLVLASVHKNDTEQDIIWTDQKLANLRIFPNQDKAYDLDVRQAGGAILLISNFTVAADTSQSRRPSLSNAAPPDQAHPLFTQLLEQTQAQGVEVQTGRFGAPMQVTLTNTGPTTFLLNSRP